MSASNWKVVASRPVRSYHHKDGTNCLVHGHSGSSLAVQPDCVKGRVVCGTVYRDMHYKDLLRSIARVVYCILFPDFYLVLHYLRCRKKTKWINQSIMLSVGTTKCHNNTIHHWMQIHRGEMIFNIYISFSRSDWMTFAPLAIVWSCLLHAIKIGTAHLEMTASLSKLYRNLKGKNSMKHIRCTWSLKVALTLLKDQSQRSYSKLYIKFKVFPVPNQKIAWTILLYW